VLIASAKNQNIIDSCDVYFLSLAYLYLHSLSHGTPLIFLTKLNVT